MDKAWGQKSSREKKRKQRRIAGSQESLQKSCRSPLLLLPAACCYCCCLVVAVVSWLAERPRWDRIIRSGAAVQTQQHWEEAASRSLQQSADETKVLLRAQESQTTMYYVLCMWILQSK